MRIAVSLERPLRSQPSMAQACCARTSDTAMASFTSRTVAAPFSIALCSNSAVLCSVAQHTNNVRAATNGPTGARGCTRASLPINISAQLSHVDGTIPAIMLSVRHMPRTTAASYPQQRSNRVPHTISHTTWSQPATHRYIHATHRTLHTAVSAVVVRFPHGSLAACRHAPAAHLNHVSVMPLIEHTKRAVTCTLRAINAARYQRRAPNEQLTVDKLSYNRHQFVRATCCEKRRPA